MTKAKITVILLTGALLIAFEPGAFQQMRSDITENFDTEFSTQSPILSLINP